MVFDPDVFVQSHIFSVKFNIQKMECISTGGRISNRMLVQRVIKRSNCNQVLFSHHVHEATLENHRVVDLIKKKISKVVKGGTFHIILIRKLHDLR